MSAATKLQTGIQLRNVSFAYRRDKEVLRITELAISPGERVFIFGPSGSGKTTLLGLLAGVLRAESGSVDILGRNLTTMSPSQRDAFRASHIGYIFQMFNLIPYLTVLENITLPCRLSKERARRLNGMSMHEAARRVADHLGIGGLLRESVTDLSVGQQQRVAAARSLIGTPEVIIADEPTSSLDYDHREKFIELLFQECSLAQATLVFVSHDRSLMPMFDRCINLAEVNEVS
jgi:putative ABC transport system ATP-binding protein